MEVSEKTKKILILLSFAPFLSIGHMVGIRGWGMSPLRRHLKRMESKEVGWVASVPHALGGRKSAARYHLTDNGVKQLAQTLGKSVPHLMDRPGTSGYGLAACNRLIDIFTAVYETAATIARCYECSDARCNEFPEASRNESREARCNKSPDLRIHLLSAGPLDAVLRVRASPYSLGMVVYRRALSLKYFEKKIREYSKAGPSRPSALLVVSPGDMADHTVARLVARNYEGLGQEALAAIAPSSRLGDPDARVWREIHRYDDQRLLSMSNILGGLPEQIIRDFVPQVEPHKRAALPRKGWRRRPALTQGEDNALYTIADWPLAKDEVIGALAGLKHSTVAVFVRTLLRHRLVCRVPVQEGDERPVLTDRGIVYVCGAARADYNDGKELWSAELGPDGLFQGGNLRTLRREIRHTDMVHDVVRMFMTGARVEGIRQIQVRPAHKSVQDFRPPYERYTSHIEPDARIDLEMRDGTRRVLLLEAERGGLSRERMKNRLRHYARYLSMKRVTLDYPTRPTITVVLRDPGMESNFSLAQEEAKLTHLPVILTNMRELEHSQAGPFDSVWRRPGNYGLRLYMDELT